MFAFQQQYITIPSTSTSTSQSYKLTSTLEPPHSELISYNNQSNTLVTLSKIERKFIVSGGGSDSIDGNGNLEKVSNALRESREAIEREREGKRYVLLFILSFEIMFFRR